MNINFGLVFFSEAVNSPGTTTDADQLQLVTYLSESGPSGDLEHCENFI